MALPKVKKIYQVAGLSLIGFCAVSVGMDKANVGPVAAQLAGFCGAFAGALIGQRRKRSRATPHAKGLAATKEPLERSAGQPAEKEPAGAASLPVERGG